MQGLIVSFAYHLRISFAGKRKAPIRNGSGPLVTLARWADMPAIAAEHQAGRSALAGTLA